MGYKLLTLNVRGLREKIKLLRLRTFLMHFNPDVILIQDSHITEELQTLVENEFNYNISFNNGSNNSRGVFTATKNEHKKYKPIIMVEY